MSIVDHPGSVKSVLQGLVWFPCRLRLWNVQGREGSWWFKVLPYCLEPSLPWSLLVIKTNCREIDVVYARRLLTIAGLARPIRGIHGVNEGV